MESKLEGISSLVFCIRCHGDAFMMASLHGRRPHGGVNLKPCSHDAISAQSPGRRLVVALLQIGVRQSNAR